MAATGFICRGAQAVPHAMSRIMAIDSLAKGLFELFCEAGLIESLFTSFSLSPSCGFDRLTVLSLPKEERVGVRRREKYLNIHLE